MKRKSAPVTPMVVKKSMIEFGKLLLKLDDVGMIKVPSEKKVEKQSLA